MSNAEAQVYLTSPEYTFLVKPEDYINLDPAFKCLPNTTEKERIRRIVEKTPLEELPKDLIPKYRLGVQPPKFYFGIFVTFKSLLDLAVGQSFAIFSADADRHYEGTLLVPETMAKLRKMIYVDLKFACSPKLCAVRTTEKSKVFLSFLSSLDGTTGFPCDPRELGMAVKEYLDLDQPLMWYLDRIVSDWHVGELYLEPRPFIDEL